MEEKQQIEKLAQELSEEELNEMAAGKMSPETRRKVLKYVNIGVGSAVGVSLAALGITAAVGKFAGKGPLKSLHGGGSPILDERESLITGSDFDLAALDAEIERQRLAELDAEIDRQKKEAKTIENARFNFSDPEYY